MSEYRKALVDVTRDTLAAAAARQTEAEYPCPIGSLTVRCVTHRRRSRPLELILPRYSVIQYAAERPHRL